MLALHRVGLIALLVPLVVWAQTPSKKDENPYSPEKVKQLLAEAQADGDSRRGAIVFGLPTLACLSCHQVGDTGGKVGPELTKVGACIPPEEIVESLLWPNRTVKPEFKAVSITTLAGRNLRGVVRKETPQELTIIDSTGKTETISKDDIESKQEIGSLMPEGLTAALTPEQRRDLIRYLLELGKTSGVEKLSHQVTKFDFAREPIDPKYWPNASHFVNRDRLYDFYTRESKHFVKIKPQPLLLPAWPGLDNGKYGHWGNQNDTVWKDGRWNDTDLGTLQAGVFRHEQLTIPRSVCVRLGDSGEMAACFNPDTLQIEAVWKGGFVSFSDFRHGFLDGLRIVGTVLPTPKVKKWTEPIRYLGFHRHGKRVIFRYRIGESEYLDSPWVKDGEFTREIAPVEKHSLKEVVKGGTPQWPQVFKVSGKLGDEKPYAIDTIPLPSQNPWKALLFFGGHDFFKDGSAALCTMQGDVWLAEGLDDALKEVRWRRIASGLHQPLGVVIHEETLYVLGRDQITKLVDLNGDREIDFYEVFSRAYVTSPAGHDFICGLERDYEGNFYTASGKEGLLKISPDGQRAEVLATGFRNPDGLGLLGNGHITVPCSEGDWTPASLICDVNPTLKTKPHFGHGGPRNGQPPALPLLYLPRGHDNSSGGQVRISSEKWGPLKDLTIHTSFGACSHFLLLRDEVDGQTQGGMIPLRGDFLSGVHRGRFSPKDGQLYLSGMNGWGSYAVEDGCFQRVRYSGEKVQVPVKFHVHQNGIMLDFSDPLKREIMEKIESHFAQAWNYRYSGAYGSREFSPSHYGTPGHDSWKVASATVLGEGKSVFLELPELQPVNQLHLYLTLDAEKTCEIFLTIHKLGEPFKNFPGYRDRPKTIAAHPILRDLAATAKKEPNPWRNPLPNVRELSLEAGKNLTFSAPTLKAKAGENLKLTFKNPDVVPHNWALIQPGKLQEIGTLTNQMIADPEAVQRHYVPRSKAVIVYTDIVEPEQSQTIFFTAPKEKGRYPYLCTFPGHWIVMNGELVVE